MQKVIVLGGGGFIGGHLAKKLKNNGFFVRIADIKQHEYLDQNDICHEFIECDLADPVAVEKAITDKTVAIVPVHLFGQCSDMEAIMDIAKRHNIHVIEDTAQAIGAEYTFKDGSRKKAGTMGIIGATSFFPSKNLGCYGDGGALFTNDDELAAKIRMIANHGQRVRYYHDEIGVNSRLDTIQAAVLKIKLNPKSDKKVLKLTDFFSSDK
jgi:dTDP-4-amino-4,6-dideoxygalactose transaminase